MAVDIIARAMAAKANSGGGNQPDLSNYVQFDDYPTSTTAGVVKNYINGFQVSGTGNPNTTVYSAEQYDTIGDYYFIGKGTLENAKDKIVGSSTPVQDLTATVTNVQNDQDESMPKQTASGEIVSINDALSYKSFEDKVDGASEQITTTGKNLFDTSSLLQTSTAIGTSTGNIYTLKPNTQYTISTNIVSNPNSDNGLEPVIGTPTSQNSFIFVSVDTNIEDVSSKNQGVGTTNNITRTLTTDDTGNIYVGVRGGFNNNLNNLIDQGGYVQIEEGSVATSYEPYTGGQASPSPDYPQPITTLTFDEITRCGKNLTDISHSSFSQNCTVENDIATTIPLNNYGWVNIGINPIVILTGTYYLSCDVRIKSGICNKLNYLRIGENKFTSVKNPAMTNYFQRYVFSNTASQQKRYTTFGIQTDISTDAVLEIKNIMISKENSEYEPYQGQTYDIDLQGNEMVELPNGVKDELVIDKYGNVSLIKNVGKIILNGSENWSLYSQNPNRFVLNTPASYINMKSSTYNTICDHYKYDASGSNYPCYATGETYAIQIYDNQFTTVDDLKAWLQSNNVTVYYQLANPQTIPLGTLSELITTLNGTNNISINGNIPTTISTTYALDIKKYIDNKLAEISTQIIKEG